MSSPQPNAVPTGAPLKVVSNGPDGVKIPIVPKGTSAPATNGSLNDTNDYDESLIHKVSPYIGVLSCQYYVSVLEERYGIIHNASHNMFFFFI